MDSDTPINPVLAEEVEHALEPYRPLLSADELTIFRSVLTEQLANDPMIARGPPKQKRVPRGQLSLPFPKMRRM